jgi:hypothetical protein
MFIFIIVLVMYFTMLNYMKYIVETNNKSIHKNDYHKNNIQTHIKKQTLYELQINHQSKYFHLFDHFQVQ